MTIVCEHLRTQWVSAGHGYSSPDGDVSITHLKHADNILLVSTSIDSIRTMLADLVWELFLRNCAIKPSSCIFLLGGSLAKQTIPYMTVETIQGEMVWTRTYNFVFLGTSTVANADSTHSLNYRLCKADGYIYLHKHALAVDVEFGEKLKYWCEGAQAVACFGTSHLHLTQSLLSSAKVWEYNWLRKLGRMRRKPDVDHRMYLSRTAKKITGTFHGANLRPLHQRLILNALRLAQAASPTLWALQTARTGAFKSLVAAIPYKRRKQEMLLQAKTGYRYNYSRRHGVMIGKAKLKGKEKVKLKNKTS